MNTTGGAKSGMRRRAAQVAPPAIKGMSNAHRQLQANSGRSKLTMAAEVELRLNVWDVFRVKMEQLPLMILSLFVRK